MVVSSLRAILDCDVQRVWDTVTDLEHYQWRSDITGIEAVSDGQFREYTKDGFATDFTITAWEPCRRWAFDLENPNLKGRWVGTFTAQGDRTELEFTEEVIPKRSLPRPLVKIFLKRQQRRYLADLKKALGC